MYYQLNNFTGRLIGSTHMQPYFPIGVNPLNKNDPPKIVFQDASVKPVKHTSPRHASSSASALYENIHKKQRLFQKPNDLPVHLKGGPMDKVLYGITLALCVVGLARSAYTLYGMSYPKKA